MYIHIYLSLYNPTPWPLVIPVRTVLSAYGVLDSSSSRRATSRVSWIASLCSNPFECDVQWFKQCGAMLFAMTFYFLSIREFSIFVCERVCVVSTSIFYLFYYLNGLEKQYRHTPFFLSFSLVLLNVNAYLLLSSYPLSFIILLSVCMRV